MNSIVWPMVRWYQQKYKFLLFIISLLVVVAVLFPFITLSSVLKEVGEESATVHSDGIHTTSTANGHGNHTSNIKLLMHHNDDLILDDRLPTLRPIQNRTIMLVHVGKAAGSTLQRTFYKKYWQPGNMLQRTPILLPICHMHACTNKTLSRATTLLFVVRNPVDRIISAYKFSHPDNCVTFDKIRGMNVTNDIWGCHMPSFAKEFYHQCAPTLEDLASVPFEHGNENIDKTCRESIRGMVGGGNEKYRKQSTHAYFNYAHYKKVTSLNDTTANGTFQNNKEIFVLRSEHLWQDASSLDMLLNGTGNFNSEQRNVTHGSENYHKHTSTVSKLGYELLCCMLIDEINVFEEIMYMAENLSEREKYDTVRDVERRCGVLTSRIAWASSCQHKFV